MKPATLFRSQPIWTRHRAYWILLFLVLIEIAFLIQQNHSLQNSGRSPGEFQADTVRLVKASADNQHVLFRGNIPISGQSARFFNYTQLTQALNQVYQKQFGRPLPEHYRLIDISLLSDGKEHQAIAIEKAYWDKHPEQGQFIHVQLPKHYFAPDNVLPELPGIIQKSWVRYESNKLNTLTNTIEQFMNPGSSSYPTVVYVHCKHGINRTGEAIGAYRMHFMDNSYQEAITDARQIGGGSIGHNETRGLQWYDYYLKQHQARQITESKQQINPQIK